MKRTSRREGRRISEQVSSLDISVQRGLRHPLDQMFRRCPPRTQNVGQDVVEPSLWDGEEEIVAVTFRPAIYGRHEIVADDNAAGDGGGVVIGPTGHADNLANTP